MRNKPERKKRQTIKDQALYKIYPFVVTYIGKHGAAPSLYEVAKKFGKTEEWVRVCYKELVKAKLIKVARYKQRGVSIINK
jgi:DNA-binding transcriptional regulator PaaX